MVITTHHTYIYTYTIGHYNTSVRIIDLVSHNTYVCVNFIDKWRDLHFLKSTPDDRFFEKLFMAIFCKKSTERKSPKEYFLYFVLMSGLGLECWLYV